jgi:hypothetical protein
MVVGFGMTRSPGQEKGGRSGEPANILPSKIEMTIRLAASSPNITQNLVSSRRSETRACEGLTTEGSPKVSRQYPTSRVSYYISIIYKRCDERLVLEKEGKLSD